MTNANPLVALRAEYNYAVEHILAGLKRAQKTYREYYNNNTLVIYMGLLNSKVLVDIDDVPPRTFDFNVAARFNIGFDKTREDRTCVTAVYFGRDHVTINDKEYPYSAPYTIQEAVYQDCLDVDVIQRLDVELAEKRFEEYLDKDRAARLERNDLTKNDISFHEYYMRLDNK